MILVKYSKFLSSIFFFLEKRPLLSDGVVFSKWVFLDDKSVILLWSKNLHFFEGVSNSWFSSKIPVTFGAYFSVKETSVFSFDDVVLSKGGVLDNKIVNVRG